MIGWCIIVAILLVPAGVTPGGCVEIRTLAKQKQVKQDKNRPFFLFIQQFNESSVVEETFSPHYIATNRYSTTIESDRFKKTKTSTKKKSQSSWKRERGAWNKANCQSTLAIFTHDMLVTCTHLTFFALHTCDFARHACDLNRKHA